MWYAKIFRALIESTLTLFTFIKGFSDVLPPKNLTGSNKAKESKFFVSAFELRFPNLRLHCIEAATNVSENGSFEEQKNLISENMEKKIVIILPENGKHEDTPFNMHLTDQFSQGSNAWLAPLQRQEKPTNIYYRKTSHFLAHFNLNPSDLDADIVLGQPVSQFGLAAGGTIGVLHQISGLTTANFNDHTYDPNPLINMNDVFAAEAQDPWDN